MLSYEDYELLEEIGKGSFGKVYKAQHENGEIHAIKIIDLDQDDEMDDVQQEINTLQTCHCQQLTNYYGSFMVGSSLWIVMELVDGGSLQDLMRKTTSTFSEATIAWIMRDMLTALAYLHSQRKIHRDVKAANVLIASDGSIRLADFGVSVQLTTSVGKRNTFIGSPYWMAPEVITQSNYNEKVDIWSLGITAIELATGYPPLSTLHPMKAVMIIPKNPPPKLPEDGNYSKKFHAFLERCLVKETDERPNAVELLKHPFIKGAKPTTQILELLETKRAISLMGDLFASSNPSSSVATPLGKNSSSRDIESDAQFGGDESNAETTKTRPRHPVHGTSWIFDTVKPSNDSELSLKSAPNLHNLERKVSFEDKLNSKSTPNLPIFSEVPPQTQPKFDKSDAKTTVSKIEEEKAGRSFSTPVSFMGTQRKGSDPNRRGSTEKIFGLTMGASSAAKDASSVNRTAPSGSWIGSRVVSGGSRIGSIIAPGGSRIGSRIGSRNEPSGSRIGSRNEPSGSRIGSRNEPSGSRIGSRSIAVGGTGQDGSRIGSRTVHGGSRIGSRLSLTLTRSAPTRSSSLSPSNRRSLTIPRPSEILNYFTPAAQRSKTEPSQFPEKGDISVNQNESLHSKIFKGFMMHRKKKVPLQDEGGNIGELPDTIIKGYASRSASNPEKVHSSDANVSEIVDAYPPCLPTVHELIQSVLICESLDSKTSQFGTELDLLANDKHNVGPKINGVYAHNMIKVDPDTGKEPNDREKFSEIYCKHLAGVLASLQDNTLQEGTEEYLAIDALSLAFRRLDSVQSGALTEKFVSELAKSFSMA